VGLAKTNRLKSYRDFRQVYESGKKYESAHLILRALLDSVSEGDQIKIGIAISQKVSKKAVTRNRIKRQIKSIIRGILPRINKSGKIVITVKIGATECQFNHFLRELEELLLKANIIHGN
jgi:ribonuclease P protein component